ncbi:HAMP domain-containing protein [Clostridium sp. 19966]|uniref:sensor histidine kinase n=1 Tax=Clostridium sp. 19966 TaxID=2768166 RepID=UPI0028DDA954|nr:ATP-binding protein [Clostridium sp. 19966]MDT8716497.1 HAMP domain-containing protein [Clostridium sp. 19966]
MLLKGISKNLKFFKSAKISIKLTVVYAFMFSFVLLILNASILYGIKYYLYNQAKKQVDDVKTIMLNKVADQTDYQDLSNKELFADIPIKENVSVRILETNGNVLISSAGFNYNINLHEPIDKFKHYEKEESHLVLKTVEIGNKSYGTIYIQIVKNLENEYNFLKILFILMAIADCVGIVASIILGYLVSRRMLRPIAYISRTAERISFNNLKERIDVRGPDDELKRLGNIFNNMIDRLQEAFNRQNQFVSDASHELRTPIAIIQGYANLLDRWGKNDKTALEKSIYGIKLEAANMANLVERLLILAKGDSGTLTVEKKEIRLNELINEVYNESKLISNNHVITNSQNAITMIIGDYKMLKQLLRIFIDNSIKFSPEYSKIDLSSVIDKNQVKIIISDNGIGIQENEIGKIFDRFYTVDKSRSKESGGTGLGLSIAKWIVDIHGGSIDVDSKEGLYTKIIVTLNRG